MGAAYGDSHPADANSYRIAYLEPCPVKQFYGNTFVEAEFAQTATIAFGKRRPVDGADRRFMRKWKVIKVHCD